jgi:ADP-ribose pyrophosphatase YjhB (NUDIX family)
MTPHHIVNVEVAIVRDGRFLLIVRGPGEAHAPGTLSLPGGKVEGEGQSEDILEGTARREAVEEVGVTLDTTLAYVRSVAFVTDEGDPVVDVVFLGRYAGGEPTVFDPEEVAAIRWLTAAEVAADPHAPPWTRRSVALAEETRLRLGW